VLARSAYHDDAVDLHGFFNGLADELLRVVERMHRHQDHSMHFLSNVMIEFLARDRALVESYVLVFQRFGRAADGVPPDSVGVRKLATARYIDRFEERQGEWRIAHRTLVFGDVQDEPLERPVVFPSNFVVQRHDTNDPLYTIRAEAG
jgi:hypothetical protein